MKKDYFLLTTAIAVVGVALLGGGNTAMAQEWAKRMKAAPAAEDYLFWGGGDPKVSSYSGKIVPVLLELLAQQRVSLYQWGGPTEGTLDNIERVQANPTHMAVGQGDVLRKYGEGITVLKERVADECLYLVGREEATLGDVVATAIFSRVATGGEKSGSYLSWKILSELIPELGDAEVIPVGGSDKIVAAVANGEADYGFFVMRPDPENPVFKEIRGKSLELIPVVSFELEGAYQFLELKVSYGGIFSSAQYHPTACTSVVWFTGDPAKIEGRAQRRLEKIVEIVRRLPDEEVRQQVAEQFASWRDYLDSVRAVAADRLRALKEKAKEAAARLREAAQ